MLDKPSSENPITVNPSAVNPLPENPTQLNTKKSNTQKQNTHGSNTDSIPFRETAAVIPPERKGRDAMSVTEIENYRELILENIEYDCLKQRYPLYLDDLNAVSYTHLDVYKRQEYQKAFERMMAATDLVMLDLKAMDAQLHRRVTGLDNANILAMARKLSDMDKPCLLYTSRCV